MISHRYKVRAILPAIALLLVPLALSAQEDDAKKSEPGGMPTYTGKGKVHKAIDMDTGAIFDIGGGVTMTFPKGIPVGHSRLVTLKFSRKRPPASLIHPKFKPQGKAISFSGAFNARRTPMVLAMKVRSEPRKRGYKLVLAIEEAGFCEKKNKKFKVGKGLCSTWRTVDAEYDHGSKRIIARIESTSGLRLQFGWIPESD